MIDCQQLVRECNKTLRSELFRDYAPNGLQLEGRSSITSILTAVTASQAAIEKAVVNKVDALLVHHGIFWGKQETRLTGTLRKRVIALLGAGINLLAWHLPLDAHSNLGNNAQLARLLGIAQRPQATPTELVAIGEYSKPVSCEVFLANLHSIFGQQSACYGACTKPITTLGWCTGAGGDFIEEAANKGIDAFLTGEASERHYHLAHELGICLFTAGHHASERYGVQALGDFLAKKFTIKHEFFDQPNPL